MGINCSDARGSISLRCTPATVRSSYMNMTTYTYFDRTSTSSSNRWARYTQPRILNPSILMLLGYYSSFEQTDRKKRISNQVVVVLSRFGVERDPFLERLSRMDEVLA